MPHPSLNRGGTILERGPRKYGLRNKDMRTRFSNLQSKGISRRTVESGRGRVDRFRSRIMVRQSSGLSVKRFTRADI